jgi:DNA-binding GntR family transcriptional regulator
MHCIQLGMNYSSAVHASIRELLSAGEFKPGERIAEIPLANRLRTSRTPVREALQRLAAEGVVQDTGRGVVVTSFSIRQIEEIYELRSCLEGLVARLVTKRCLEGRIADIDIDELRSIVSRTKHQTRANKDTQALIGNEAFHRNLAHLSGNEEVERTLASIWDRIRICIPASLVDSRRRNAVDPEHQSILDAITNGNEELASQLATTHVLLSTPQRD